MKIAPFSTNFMNSESQEGRLFYSSDLCGPMENPKNKTHKVTNPFILQFFVKIDCVARATLWFCSVFFLLFFVYAADLSLFPETGKGLTCVVFVESLDLRLD